MRWGRGSEMSSWGCEVDLATPELPIPQQKIPATRNVRELPHCSFCKTGKTLWKRRGRTMAQPRGQRKPFIQILWWKVKKPEGAPWIKESVTGNGIRRIKKPRPDDTKMSLTLNLNVFIWFDTGKTSPSSLASLFSFWYKILRRTVKPWWLMMVANAL